MNKILHINISSDTIQNVRLIHAISESNYDISIKEKDYKKYEKLKEVFNMKIANYEDSNITIEDIKISHSAPQTNFGSFKNNLIFPKVITKKCKLMWDERTIKYSFTGLMTPNRAKCLNQFIKRLYPDSKENIKVPNKYFLKLKNIFVKAPKVCSTQIEDILLWESDKGRKFPYKSWDDEYYQILSNTKFVLCPNGDFIWTYRFFEAILCGAIPIIEDSCDMYNGYKYKFMHEDIESYQWNREDVEHNYNLLIERMTFNNEELNKEIKKIIERNDEKLL